MRIMAGLSRASAKRRTWALALYFAMPPPLNVMLVMLPMDQSDSEVGELESMMV
jgi:hypothetical protein